MTHSFYNLYRCSNDPNYDYFTYHFPAVHDTDTGFCVKCGQRIKSSGRRHLALATGEKIYVLSLLVSEWP